MAAPDAVGPAGSDLTNQTLADVTSALAQSDWTHVETAIRRIPLISLEAAGTEHRDLLAEMRLYNEGRPEEARNATAALIASGRETAAASQFALFLNSRKRASYLTAAIGPLGCVYAVVLLCSVYLGLRQNLHRLRTS